MTALARCDEPLFRGVDVYRTKARLSFWFFGFGFYGWDMISLGRSFNEDHGWNLCMKFLAS